MTVISQCLCLKFRKLSRTSGSLYDGALQSTGLTSSQFSVLRNIHRFEPTGIAHLADVMLTERTTLTRNFELLTEQDLVTFEQSERDKRIQRPTLTSAGRERLKIALPFWRKAQRRILGGIGAGGWDELQAALRAVAAIGEEGPEVAADLLDWRPRASSSQRNEFDPGTVRRCVNSTLRGAARVVTREYDAALRESGVKVTQLHVLAAIAENPGARITDLGALLIIDQTTATLAVSSFRRQGWLLDGRGKAQGRAIVLSAKGEAVLKQASVEWARYQSDKLDTEVDAARWTAVLDQTLTAALRARPEHRLN